MKSASDMTFKIGERIPAFTRGFLHGSPPPTALNASWNLGSMSVTILNGTLALEPMPISSPCSDPVARARSSSAEYHLVLPNAAAWNVSANASHSTSSRIIAALFICAIDQRRVNIRRAAIHHRDGAVKIGENLKFSKLPTRSWSSACLSVLDER